MLLQCSLKLLKSLKEDYLINMMQIKRLGFSREGSKLLNSGYETLALKHRSLML